MFAAVLESSQTPRLGFGGICLPLSDEIVEKCEQIFKVAVSLLHVSDGEERDSGEYRFQFFELLQAVVYDQMVEFQAVNGNVRRDVHLDVLLIMEEERNADRRLCLVKRLKGGFQQGLL